MVNRPSANGKSAVPDDVEAQHESPWLSKVEETLRVMTDQVPNEMGFHILKVAEYFRQPPAQYDPVGWRFGLHNREDLDVTGSEALKLSCVVAFGLEDHSEWNQFCNAVVPDPKSMLECYGLHREVSSLSEREIQQVLALDALFLAVSGDAQLDDQDRRLWTLQCRKRNPQEYFIVLTTENRQVLEDYVDQPTQSAAKEGVMERGIKYIKNCTNRKREDGDHPGSGAEVGHVPGEPYLEKWMKGAVRRGLCQFMDLSDDFYERKMHVQGFRSAIIFLTLHIKPSVEQRE